MATESLVCPCSKDYPVDCIKRTPYCRLSCSEYATYDELKRQQYVERVKRVDAYEDYKRCRYGHVRRT